MGATDTTTLMQVQSRLKPVATFILDTFFARQVNFQDKYIAFDEIETDHRMAPFVSPMVSGKVQRQMGNVLKKFEPGYLKPKDVVDPSRVLSRVPGEALEGELQPAQRAEAVKVSLLQSQKDRIDRRLENMAVRGMLDGKIVVEGKDFPEMEIDFGRDANLTVTLTGSSVWSDSAADPIADLEAMAADMESPLTDIVMNNKAFGLFRAHEKVKATLDTNYRGNTSGMDLGLLNGQEVQWKGNLGGVDVWVYTAGYKDDAGVKHMHFADNEVLCASRACEGVRAYAAILDPRAGYMAVDKFPKNWYSEDPAAEYLMTQSAPAMLVANTNATGKLIIGA